MVGGLAALARAENKRRKRLGTDFMINYARQYSSEDPAILRLYVAARNLQRDTEEPILRRNASKVNPYDLSSF